MSVIYALRTGDLTFVDSREHGDVNSDNSSRRLQDNFSSLFVAEHSSHDKLHYFYKSAEEYISTTTEPPDILSSFAVTSAGVVSATRSIDMALFKFIVLGVMGSVLAILGFVGNALSIVVLHRRQMRSSTSYYLLSLAVYDNGILLGMTVYFCIPALLPYIPSFANYRDFMSYSLPLGYPLSLSVQMGSIYTCVGFTVERFIAVCRPLHAANTCTRSRTIRAIILIFIWSMAYNTPRYFVYRVSPHKHHHSFLPSNASKAGSASNSLFFTLCWNHTTSLGHLPSWCNTSNLDVANHVILNNSQPDSLSHHVIRNVTRLPPQTPRPKLPLHEMTEFGKNHTFSHLYLIYMQLFFMFLLPFLVILFMNIGLIRAVRHSRSMHQNMAASARKEQNLTVMLIAVIVVFLICQFPSIVDNILVAVIGEDKLKKNGLYLHFYVICSFMVEINAASNFLLYCFFGKKFRLMLLKILHIKRNQHKVAYRSTVSKSRTNGTRTYEMEVSL